MDWGRKIKQKGWCGVSDKCFDIYSEWQEQSWRKIPFYFILIKKTV